MPQATTGNDRQELSLDALHKQMTNLVKQKVLDDVDSKNRDGRIDR